MCHGQWETLDGKILKPINDKNQQIKKTRNNKSIEFQKSCTK